VAEQLLVYDVEQYISDSGEVEYKLHGKRASYTLKRRRDGTLYALNSRGSICAIKGNYTFSDASGRLEVLTR